MLSRHLGLTLLLCCCSALARDCIGVIPSGGGASFWGLVEAGARQAGAELELDIYYRGPTRENDTVAQLKAIDKMLARGCKAIVVAPAGAALAEKAAQLRQLGVPLLYIDRDMGGDAVRAVITTNNFQAGVLAGKQMVVALKGKKRVAVVRLAPHVVSTYEREQGFIHAANAAGLEIVFDQSLAPDGVATLAALRTKLDEVDGIFTPNGTSSSDTLAALKRIKQAGKRIHIGFDSSSLLVEAVQQGEMYGLVVQQPFAMGLQSVQLAQRLLQGEVLSNPRLLIDLPVVFVNRDNLQKPEIAGLLQLPSR